MRRPLLGLAVLGAALLAVPAPATAQSRTPQQPDAAVTRVLREHAAPPARLRKPRGRKARAAPAPPVRPYTLATTWQHTLANFEFVALAAVPLTYFSFVDWNRGESRPFHTTREGWFGRETYAGGMDKLGHAFTSAVVADLFTETLKLKGFDPHQSAASGAITSWLLMGAMEIGDGFYRYGFSFEDLTFNTLGALFSYFRNTTPGLKQLLDFRVQYQPKSLGSVSEFQDYSDRKFLLALKLSGFEQARGTPLQFLELHLGYFARGFSEHERAFGALQERSLYAGLGLNLTDAVFSLPTLRGTFVDVLGRFVTEHAQGPYTSVATRR